MSAESISALWTRPGPPAATTGGWRSISGFATRCAGSYVGCWLGAGTSATRPSDGVWIKDIDRLDDKSGQWYTVGVGLQIHDNVALDRMRLYA